MREIYEKQLLYERKKKKNKMDFGKSRGKKLSS